MGFHGCWLAAKDIDDDFLAGIIGLSLTDEEISHPFEAPHCFGHLPNGWTLCVLSNWEERLVQPDLLSKVSYSTEVMACLVEESSMICSAQLWSNGRKVWEVTHNAQIDVNHLEFEGVPASALLETYRKQAIASRESDEEVDFMFDVPLTLARDITGFKHDDELPEGAQLVRIDLASEDTSNLGKADAKPWWKFW